MKIKKKKCDHCNNFFVPDKYNYHVQSYCSKSECRHASRIASRRNYRRKDTNRTPEKRKKESKRIKKWQKTHPDYKNRQKNAKKKSEEPVLRDIAPTENLILRDIAQLQKAVSLIPILQNKITYYQCVTAGLASSLSGECLRDIIGGQLDRYYDIGNRLFLSKDKKHESNILNERNNSYEKQSSDQCQEKASNP